MNAQVKGVFYTHRAVDQSIFGSITLWDAIKAQQRPKFEEYLDLQFCVFKTVFYNDEKGEVSTGEIICFIGFGVNYGGRNLWNELWKYARITITIWLSSGTYKPALSDNFALS